MFGEYKGTALILDPPSSLWQTWTQSWTWTDNLHSHHAIKWPHTAGIQKLYQITAALSKTTAVVYLKRGNRSMEHLSHYHGGCCPFFSLWSTVNISVFLFFHFVLLRHYDSSASWSWNTNLIWQGDDVWKPSRRHWAAVLQIQQKGALLL